jgi:hypothetical protein
MQSEQAGRVAALTFLDTKSDLHERHILAFLVLNGAHSVRMRG